jgi:hypothetical protein
MTSPDGVDTDEAGQPIGCQYFFGGGYTYLAIVADVQPMAHPPIT